MPGNSFGYLFRITTFGESHGPGIGVVIDGCPADLVVDSDAITYDLQRRRPGQSAITTSRSEAEAFQIQSGVVDDVTTGAPLTIWIPNTNARPKDYGHLEKVYRPSHADYTYEAKYGLRDVRGGGRSSARETAARVAAGAIAKMILRTIGIEIHGFVSSVGNLALDLSDERIDLQTIETNPVRCPVPAVAREMETLIKKVKKDGDTVGGIVHCTIKNCPVGLGEPVFDKLHADLGKAMLSINACKGFEIGSGFEGSTWTGSRHNDIFYNDGGKVRTKTNHSGGVQGGISNGMDITFNVAFKPVSTLMKTQQSVSATGEEVEVLGKGRHDPCVVPRAVPIVEAMAAIVLVDHYLRHRVSRLKQ